MTERSCARAASLAASGSSASRSWKSSMMSGRWISATNAPFPGTSSTSPSRESRWSASRIGVRLASNRCETSCSGSGDPGGESAVDDLVAQCCVDLLCSPHGPPTPVNDLWSDDPFAVQRSRPALRAARP